MNAARFLYRTRQFWQALGTTTTPEDLEQARAALSSSLFALFQRLQPSEQLHSLLVWQALRERGESNPDLWVAALLHDVGKSRFPLRLWERVAIVLAKSFCPGCSQRWGETSQGGEERVAKGWRRAFIVCTGHPTWGAEMAAAAGASPLAVALIRRHQEELPPAGRANSLEDRLLRKLQAVDDES
jgi:hypothetical protein